MDDILKGIFIALGAFGLIWIFRNWNRIPKIGSSTTNINADEITCEFINDKGEKVTLKGNSNDPEFIKMCERHKTTQQPITLPYYSGYWYPYQFYYGYPYQYYYYPSYYYFRGRRGHH